PRLSGYAQRAPSKNTQLEVSCSMLPRTPYIKPTFKLILESAVQKHDHHVRFCETRANMSR
ncbi:MAG: hypothetical protein KBG39_06695, partial [Opitutaceae bacterium]|nr:hypothetical protein [Opitutaceae bacterium]